MKNTTPQNIISQISKQCIEYKLTLLLCDLKIFFIVAYSFFWLFSPFASALYFSEKHLPIIGLGCLSLFYFNCRLIGEDIFINKCLNKNMSARKELLFDMYSKHQIKYLLKKNINGSADYFEFIELRDRLREIGIDINKLQGIKSYK